MDSKIAYLIIKVEDSTAKHWQEKVIGVSLSQKTAEDISHTLNAATHATGEEKRIYYIDTTRLV